MKRASRNLRRHMRSSATLRDEPNTTASGIRQQPLRRRIHKQRERGSRGSGAQKNVPRPRRDQWGISSVPNPSHHGPKLNRNGQAPRPPGHDPPQVRLIKSRHSRRGRANIGQHRHHRLPLGRQEHHPGVRLPPNSHDLVHSKNQNCLQSGCPILHRHRHRGHRLHMRRQRASWRRSSRSPCCHCSVSVCRSVCC